MKSLKRKEVVAMLNSEGFYSSSVGKHEIFSNEAGVRIPLPQHKEISAGTLRDIKRTLAKLNIKLAV